MPTEAPMKLKPGDDVYRQLQEHLDTLPVPFPATKSGVEISLLKRIFTPEEAKIASKLTFAWDEYESLDSIYERLKNLGYSKARLEKLLDSMTKKGGLMAHVEGSKKSYSNAMLIYGMFELQINKLTPGFVQDMIQYFKDGWAQANSQIPIPQMRVVPLGVSIEQKTAVFTYDDIKTIIATAKEPFSLANCVCRQAKDVLGKPCKNTPRREVCIAWDAGAKLYIKLGWGREISRAEVLATLKQNEEEGMIIQASNAQRPDFICSCCTCCDMTLRFLKRTPMPATLVASNYFAKSNSDTCTRCGTCIDRCQMEAITLQDDKAFVDANRCIGCGNCVKTCPSEAMHLEKKAFETSPPPTMAKLYEQIASTRGESKSQ